MRPHAPHFLAFALFTTLVACFAPTSAWALVAPMDFESLSKAADSVVVATEVSSSAHYADSSSPLKGLIVTDTKFRVTDVADGARPQTLTVTQPGGVVGDVGLRVDSYPQFSAGETCVLFLDSQNDVVGGHQGKLDVSRGRVPEYSISVGELGDKVRGARRGQKVPRRPELPDASPMSTTGSTAGIPAASAEQGAASVATLAAASAVSITSVSPTKGIAGVDRVSITGSGFGATRGTGRVVFVDGLSTSGGPLTATIDSWSDTSVVCQVPRNAASGQMYVFNGSNVFGRYVYDTSFSTAGLTWGTKPATLRINEGAPTMIGEADQIQAAMATWNAPTQNFQLAFSPAAVPAGTYPPAGADDVNSVQFASLASAPGALAVTVAWYEASTLKFTEADIYFDSARNWGSTASGGVLDLQTVALHELGHIVGLDDQYPNTWRVMGAYSGVNRRELSADEIAGVNYLYGANPVDVLPTTPAVSSASHPVQTQWYASTAVSFTFNSTAPEGIKGYAYVLDGSVATDPGATVTTADTSASYDGLSQGEYYFHVRAISMLDRLGPTTHFRVRVGVAPGQVLRPVYRFYNTKKGVHFYTADEAEKQRVQSTLSATYRYEGVAYAINITNSDNSQPLYRFYNVKKGVHFYTASEAEKQRVRSTLSATYRYEGVAYSVCVTPIPDVTPVHRFFNTKKGVHFYTADEAEKQSVIKRASAVYSYEGVGYYLAP